MFKAYVGYRLYFVGSLKLFESAIPALHVITQDDVCLPLLPKSERSRVKILEFTAAHRL